MAITEEKTVQESWIFILFSWISSRQSKQVDLKSIVPPVRPGRHGQAGNCRVHCTVGNLSNIMH